MSKQIYLLISIVLLGIVILAYSLYLPSIPKKRVSLSSFFDKDSIITFSLMFNNEEFKLSNEGKRYYHHAELSYTSNQQAELTKLSVKIKLRGQFRSDTNYCNLPQLKIVFPKGITKEPLFGQTKSANLVLPCQKNITDYEQYVLQEYLIYKMYNLLTEHSYRVRLVKLNLINSGEKKDTIQTMAFFKESDEDLAARLKGKIVKTLPIDSTKINPLLMQQVAIFQYLIGNDDWSETSMHNIKMLLISNSLLYPIPFDFDFSGLVAAPYSDFDSTTFYQNTAVHSFSSDIFITEFLVDQYAETQDSCLLLFKKNVWLSAKTKERSLAFLQRGYKDIMALKSHLLLK